MVFTCSYASSKCLQDFSKTSQNNVLWNDLEQNKKHQQTDQNFVERQACDRMYEFIAQVQNPYHLA